MCKIKSRFCSLTRTLPRCSSRKGEGRPSHVRGQQGGLFLVPACASSEKCPSGAAQRVVFKSSLCGSTLGRPSSAGCARQLGKSGGAPQRRRASRPRSTTSSPAERSTASQHRVAAHRLSPRSKFNSSRTDTNQTHLFFEKKKKSFSSFILLCLFSQSHFSPSRIWFAFTPC